MRCPDTAKSSRYNQVDYKEPFHECCPDTAKSSRYNHFAWLNHGRRSCPDTAKSSRYNPDQATAELRDLLS